MRAFNGLLLAIIQGRRAVGDILVTARAEGLSGTQCTVQTH
jgi:hypothetical protein